MNDESQYFEEEFTTNFGADIEIHIFPVENGFSRRNENVFIFLTFKFATLAFILPDRMYHTEGEVRDNITQ